MFTEEKKKNTSYGTVFLYCFFCLVLVVEVVRFTKPYYNLKENLMAAEAIVEEGFMDFEEKSLPCKHSISPSVSAPARNHQKLSGGTSYRARPPSSYCVKFESFLTMSKLVKDGMYESRPFSLGGYNWTFLVYPNGNKLDGGSGYVSVYAKIDNSSLIANPRDVYAEFKFFAYDRSREQYFVYQETEAQRLHLFKTQWGVATFLPQYYFTPTGTSFIFDGGKSVFGVDIFVAQPFDKWEVFSTEENIRDPLFNWQLSGVSLLTRDYYTSDTFSSGGKNWTLKVYPNGVGNATRNSLSLYLLSESNEMGYVSAKLRILDQIGSIHFAKQVEGGRNATENGWGFDKFIPLVDLRNSSKGLLVKDTIKFEVEMVSLSKTDFF